MGKKLFSTVSMLAIVLSAFILWWCLGKGDDESDNRWKIGVTLAVIGFGTASFAKFYYFSNKSTFHFISCGVPFLPTICYFPKMRHDDEKQKLFNDISQLCEHPGPRALVISGENGVGKTTLIAQLFAEFRPKCQNIAVVWLNCLPWRHKFNELEFQKMILEKTTCHEIEQIHQHFSKNRDAHVLFVFDDMLNVDLLKFFLDEQEYHLGELSLCIITTNPHLVPAKNIRKIETIAQLSGLKIEAFLKNYTPNFPIREFRHFVNTDPSGLLLIAELLAKHPETEVETVDFSNPIVKLLHMALEKNGEKARHFFYEFLFFDPGEILFEQNFKVFIDFFKQKNLIRQIAEHSDGKESHSFFVHQLIWEAAFEMACKELSVPISKNQLEQLRIRIRLRTREKLATLTPGLQYLCDFEKWRFSVVSDPNTSKFMLALVDGNVNLVKNVLSTEKPSESRHEALFVAAKCGHLNLLIFLANNSEKCLTWVDDDGNSLVHLAAINCHIKVVDYLLEHPKCRNLVSTPNKAGQTPVWLAAMNGHLELVELLREISPDTVSRPANNGTTPLSISAHFGHFEVVKRLAKLAHETVTHKALDGTTPLWLAAENGHLPIVKFLANLDREVVYWPAKEIDGIPLFPAAYNGHLDVVKYLSLLAPETVSERASNGATPIWIAAMNGQTQVVRFLGEIARETLVLPDNLGTTPLWIAAANGHVETVRVLSGLAPETTSTMSNSGATPLWIAAMNGHLEVVKFLSEQAPQTLKAVNKSGGTPLLIAALNGHLEIVKFLTVASPESISSADHHGSTPVILAALRGHLEVVKCLALISPDLLTATTADSETALWLAAANGHFDVVVFVAKMAPMTDIANADGVTPLQIATKNEHTRVANFLFETIRTHNK